VVFLHNDWFKGKYDIISICMKNAHIAKLYLKRNILGINSAPYFVQIVTIPITKHLFKNHKNTPKNLRNYSAYYWEMEA
jgi:hypothetical protein